MSGFFDKTAEMLGGALGGALDQSAYAARLKVEADAEATRKKKAEIEGAQIEAQGMRGRGQTILTGRGA